MYVVDLIVFKPLCGLWFPHTRKEEGINGTGERGSRKMWKEEWIVLFGKFKVLSTSSINRARAQRRAHGDDLPLHRAMFVSCQMCCGFHAIVRTLEQRQKDLKAQMLWALVHEYRQSIEQAEKDIVTKEEYKTQLANKMEDYHGRVRFACTEFCLSLATNLPTVVYSSPAFTWLCSLNTKSYERSFGSRGVTHVSGGSFIGFRRFSCAVMTPFAKQLIHSSQARAFQVPCPFFEICMHRIFSAAWLQRTSLSRCVFWFSAQRTILKRSFSNSRHVMFSCLVGA